MNARTPSDAPASRMQPLARLPVFLALRGKRALVVGGGPPAAWKAELLAASGAQVEVIAPEPCAELESLATDVQGVSLVRRVWRAEDLADTSIVVGDCDEADATRLVSVARARGIPVNIVDKPAFCDFTFGAIVNRSPLVIGISTDGAAPLFGQAIRAKLEAMIPQGFAAWADAARAWRKVVQASGLAFGGRRRFWQLFTRRAITEPNHAPSEIDLDALLAQTRHEGAASENGSVTLVGAGPGDPELLTLRAVRALQSADVILFDDLVSSEVLDFARREARKILVGKSGNRPSCKQEDINTLMVGLAKGGKRVVRLKGGDPMIFGRAAEEIAACRDGGITVEVVPGITAAQGAASRLAVSLTGRGHAHRLQYVTGHAAKGQLPQLDWPTLADPAVTTAIYMPQKHLAAVLANAREAGLDAQTSAVAIARATQKDEQTIVATVATLPDQLALAAPAGPVLVLVGRVLSGLAVTSAATNAGDDIPTAQDVDGRDKPGHDDVLLQRRSRT